MVLFKAIYMETHLDWPHLVPFKAVHLIQVANLRYPLDPKKTELCTVYNSECAETVAQFGEQVHDPVKKQ